MIASAFNCIQFVALAAQWHTQDHKEGCLYHKSQRKKKIGGKEQKKKKGGNPAIFLFFFFFFFFFFVDRRCRRGQDISLSSFFKRYLPRCYTFCLMCTSSRCLQLRRFTKTGVGFAHPYLMSVTLFRLVSNHCLSLLYYFYLCDSFLLFFLFHFHFFTLL
jgi:hypothetical protein